MRSAYDTQHDTENEVLIMDFKKLAQKAQEKLHDPATRAKVEGVVAKAQDKIKDPETRAKVSGAVGKAQAKLGTVGKKPSSEAAPQPTPHPSPSPSPSPVPHVDGSTPPTPGPTVTP